MRCLLAICGKVQPRMRYSRTSFEELPTQNALASRNVRLGTADSGRARFEERPTRTERAFRERLDRPDAQFFRPYACY